MNAKLYQYLMKTNNKPGLFSKPLTVCPLCKSKNIKPYYLIKNYKQHFKTDKCTDCGFIFMNPRFGNKVLKDMYSEHYYTGNAEYKYYDERDAEKYSRYVWEKRVRKIRQYADGGSFLDVGCAFGGLLKTASEHFTPYGIELSEYSAGYAKKAFGSKIHCGSLADHRFKRGSFSVITMIELLEHIADPVFAINECYKLLIKGGLLVVQTANMNALQARILKDMYAYFMPGHVSYFSKKNLTDILIKAGFSKIKVYYPVEFGLLPKLLKSRYTFKSLFDYRHWMRIAYYHCISKLHFKDFAATSSMVIYAVK
ncbi:MAG: class I SAM-dependent methyltransferase [Spirochaetota bacterium]